MLIKRNNTHDWNDEKPYEGDLQILNGNMFSDVPVCSLLSVCWLLLWRGRGLQEEVFVIKTLNPYWSLTNYFAIHLFDLGDR